MHEEMKDSLRNRFAQRVLFDVPLKSYTSLKVGGPADALVTPNDRRELKDLLSLCAANGISWRLLGGGTNLLIPDQGLKGVVILLSEHFINYHFEPLEHDQTILHGECGVRVSRLLAACMERAFSGLEFAAGIPGSLGGVLWMNAGTKDGEVKDIVESIEVLTAAGEEKTLTRNQIHYRYRTCGLPSGTVILAGRLKLRSGDAALIRARVEKIKGYRSNQPLRWPNAGSVFKNPPGDFAGRLIEAAGLKGLRVGGAMVSEQHGNFIINQGGATAADVKELIRRVQTKVKEDTGIALECELEVF